MNRDIDEYIKKELIRKEEQKNEEKLNPLSKYTTTQLKEELRRRKRNE